MSRSPICPAKPLTLKSAPRLVDSPLRGTSSSTSASTAGSCWDWPPKGLYQSPPLVGVQVVLPSAQRRPRRLLPVVSTASKVWVSPSSAGLAIGWAAADAESSSAMAVQRGLLVGMAILSGGGQATRRSGGRQDRALLASVRAVCAGRGLCPQPSPLARVGVAAGQVDVANRQARSHRSRPACLQATSACRKAGARSAERWADPGSVPSSPPMQSGPNV